jgi:DUF438 domain-containing protein
MQPSPNVLLAPKVLHGLPETHLIATLVREHLLLLEWLDRLDVLMEDYRDAAGTQEARTIHAEIRALAERLAGAEPHHEKEERVLFPALEARGVAMPPRMMRREHDELRRWKKRLLAAAHETHPDTEAIAEPVGTLAALLRDHIHKENEVLYPMALSVIPDPADWVHLTRQAELVGTLTS